MKGLIIRVDFLVNYIKRRKKWEECNEIREIQFSSVAQLCPTLRDPMNHSTSGLPIHHQLPEFTQTHVHRVGDALQPSHPPSSPSPAPNPSQNQSFPISQLFTWGGQSIGVSALASVLPKNTLDWSPLEWTGWISLLIVILYNGSWKYNGETICTGKLFI